MAEMSFLAGAMHFGQTADNPKPLLVKELEDIHTAAALVFIDRRLHPSRQALGSKTWARLFSQFLRASPSIRLTRSRER